MEFIGYIIASVIAGIIAFFGTHYALTNIIGCTIHYADDDGKRYMVLQRPKETELQAVKRLHVKILKGRNRANKVFKT